MPDLRVAAALEHVQEADEVGINVGRGVFNRVTHPCLRGQMHDCTEFAGGEKLAHRPALDDVELVTEEPGTRKQALEARLLEPDVVVVVQVVDAHNLVTAIEQPVRQRRTDEPGSSRYKNLHFLSVSNVVGAEGLPRIPALTIRARPTGRPLPGSPEDSCFAISMHRGTCRRVCTPPSSQSSFRRAMVPHSTRSRPPHGEGRARRESDGRSRARMPAPPPAP